MSVRFIAAVCILVVPSSGIAGSAVKVRLDAHGFPLPDGAIARLGDLHFAQKGWITALALSPNGKVIASAGRGIVLWNAETGLTTREIPCPGAVAALTFSKNGF